MRFLMYVLFGLLYLLILFLSSFYNSETIFLAKSLFLTLYVSAEIIVARMEDRNNWIINPIVLASVLTFLLGYGVTNLIYFIPDSTPRNNLLSALGSSSFDLMSATMDYVILGAVCMWIGFKSNLGIFLYRFMTIRVLDITKYFRKTFTFNKGLIYTFIAVSVLIRFYAISIGTYYYAQSPEEIAEAAGISQYLFLLGSLAQYSLVIVSIVYYSSIDRKSYRNLFIALLLIEIFFGFISGMKSLVVLPFVVPLLAYLIIKKKINKSFLVLSAVSIIIAYIVIEPFRIMRFLDPNFRSTPQYIIQTLYDAYILNKQVGLGEEKSAEFFVFAFLSRSNYMIEAAMAIDYEKKVGLNEHDPDFLERLYLAPLHAVIPRFIWTSKPFEATGLWFTQRVQGSDVYSATGFTPFGYLNFAGGVLFIGLFFFIFGIMQNALFRFIELGSGGIIIFVGLLSSMVLIETSVNAIFVTWIRYYPLLFLMQYITFKD